jgi:membrane associated rhomboid family serine protease
MNISLTLAIILITCGISLLAMSNPVILGNLIMNPYITNRKNQYYRFITSGFIHKDYMHLGFNMISFYFFGDEIEAWLGGFRFIVLYIAAIVIADIPTYLKYKNDPNYNSLGASGGVSAIIFASILLRPMNMLGIYFIIPVPAFLFGIFYLIYSYYMDKRSNQEINHSAHFYGAVVGIVYTSALYPKLLPAFFTKIFEEIQKIF